jgi:hypothetical protein
VKRKNDHHSPPPRRIFFDPVYQFSWLRFAIGALVGGVGFYAAGLQWFSLTSFWYFGLSLAVGIFCGLYCAKKSDYAIGEVADGAIFGPLLDWLLNAFKRFFRRGK